MAVNVQPSVAAYFNKVTRETAAARAVASFIPPPPPAPPGQRRPVGRPKRNDPMQLDSSLSPVRIPVHSSAAMDDDIEILSMDYSPPSQGPSRSPGESWRRTRPGPSAAASPSDSGSLARLRSMVDEYSDDEDVAEIRGKRQYIIIPAEHKLLIARAARCKGAAAAAHAYKVSRVSRTQADRFLSVLNATTREVEELIPPEAGADQSRVLAREAKISLLVEERCLKYWGRQWSKEHRSLCRALVRSEAIKTACETLVIDRAAGVTVSLRHVRRVLIDAMRIHQPETLDRNPLPLSTPTLLKFMHNNGFNYRRTTSKRGLTDLPSDKIEMIERNFLARVGAVVKYLKIPAELVINFDQTGVVLFRPSAYTWDLTGTRRVFAPSASSEKAAITAVLATSAANDILPPQLIFAGKTERCLPPDSSNVAWADWSLTFTETHWSSPETMTTYIQKILLPYVRAKRASLNLSDTQPALIIMDLWCHHRSELFVRQLKANHLFPVFVPGGTTGKLQPQDVSFNRPFKAKLTEEFDNWFAGLPSEEREQSGRIKVLKTQVLSWVGRALDHCKASSNKIVGGGWRKSGLHNAITCPAFQQSSAAIFPNLEDAIHVPEQRDYRDANRNRDLRVLPMPELPDDEEEVIDEGRVEIIAGRAEIISVYGDRNLELLTDAAKDALPVMVLREPVDDVPVAPGGVSSAASAPPMDVDGAVDAEELDLELNDLQIEDDQVLDEEIMID